MHYRMTLPEFICLCKSLPSNNGTLYDYLYQLELEFFSFLSKNVLVAMSHSFLFLNSVRQIQNGNRDRSFIKSGDIIEISNSIFVEIYILFFNIMHFCKLTFFRKKMFFALYS
jgi:hypothetical protein